MIDINEEAKQEPIEEVIEEAKEEQQTEQVNEIVETPAVEEETKTEKVEEVCKEVKKPKRAQDKLVTCPKCNESMKLKSYRYNHEKNCGGTLEQKPVKPFSKPRATPKPKPEPTIEVEEREASRSIREPKLTQPVSNQILKPNPLTDITNHYKLLQEQYIQQKREKYNNLCQNMFASRSKRC